MIRITCTTTTIYIYIYIVYKVFNNNNDFRGGRAASTSLGSPYRRSGITGKSGIHLAPSRFGFSQSPLPALCREATSYAWCSRLRKTPNSPGRAFNARSWTRSCPPSRATKQRRTSFQIKGFVPGWLEPMGPLGGGHKRMFLHVWWFSFRRPESD